MVARKTLDLRVLAMEVPLEEALGPRAGYDASSSAAVREKIVRRVGEAPIAILGSGEMGVVYGLPSGKVLKVTHDQSEVEAFSKLIGIDHPHLIKTFDAFYVVDDPKSSKPMGAGVVIRESVDQTISDLDILEVEMALVEAVLKAGGEARGDVCRGMEAFLKELDRGAVEFEFHRMMLRDVAAGVRKLKSLGICSFDFGPSNVGLIEERLVLYDVGSAEVKGADPDLV